MALEEKVNVESELRQRIISIGIPILLADGERMLRGPVLKSEDAYHGWVDLTAANMKTWQNRLKAIRETVRAEINGDTSSHQDRLFNASRHWHPEEGFPDLGEIVAWIFIHEDEGMRMK